MFDIRRLAVAGAALAVVLVLVFASAAARDDGRPPPAEATTTVVASTTDGARAAEPDTAAGPSPVETPVAVGDGTEAGGAAPTPAEIEAAKAVAAEFAVGFSSYRFDEPETAPLDRVRHLVTPDVALALGTNSGAGAERERQVARQEVAQASLDAIVTGGFDADHVLFTVVVAQQVAGTDGTAQHLLSYQVSLARSGPGWVVTGVSVG
jgi:hypothetical protein